MNQLMNLQNNELTMSSREIAELTDKLHKNVKRDTVHMFEQLKIDALSFERTYLDAMNRKQSEYLLPKKYIECLLTGYSIPLRMKVIDRMHELEKLMSNQQVQIPQSLPEALRLAAELAEEKMTLEYKVNELEPKAEFHDKVVAADDAISLAQAAKMIGTGRNRLCKFLRQIKWLRRNNEPYQDKIEQGLLDVKLSKWNHPEMGLQQSITTLVTGKGLAKLSQILSINQAA